MSSAGRQIHWENVYTSKEETGVSWYQDSPAPSIDLIEECGTSVRSAIIDVGGGASKLVDSLIARGFEDVTVLDLSGAALEAAKARLGAEARRVDWIIADVTTWEPPKAYDVWHDRAAFHFLTEPDDRSRYVECLRRAVRAGGHAIMGTFAPDGPDKCSGLPVVRHDAASLGEALGSGFRLVDTRRHEHLTPWGTQQHFQFSTFRRDD